MKCGHDLLSFKQIFRQTKQMPRKQKMKIATAWTTEIHADAVMEAYARLTGQLGSAPNMLLLHCSTGYDMEKIAERFAALDNKMAIHGGTSFSGVMTESGIHSQSSEGLGLFGVCDEHGNYGTGSAPIGDEPQKAAKNALLQALEQAGRSGEIPYLILMTAALGYEEELISGIEAIVGQAVPIIGGSSAGNECSGQPKQLANSEVSFNSIVLTVMFPSTDILFAFQSGYEPTGHTGTATRTKRHQLCEIDHRPAALVYNEWNDGLLSEQIGRDANIMQRTAMRPFGRIVGHVGAAPYYLLSHPEQIHSDGSLSLFSDIRENDRIVLMTGTIESLVSRAGRVVSTALETHSATADDIAGGLIIFCAGCILAMKGQLNEVTNDIRKVIPGKPFLGIFTFGEQGCFTGGENRHGNLMISVLLFTRSGSRYDTGSPLTY